MRLPKHFLGYPVSVQFCYLRVRLDVTLTLPLCAFSLRALHIAKLTENKSHMSVPKFYHLPISTCLYTEDNPFLHICVRYIWFPLISPPPTPTTHMNTSTITANNFGRSSRYHQTMVSPGPQTCCQRFARSLLFYLQVSACNSFHKQHPTSSAWKGSTYYS